MNFPAVLDVGLGLAVVFFLLASICSILVEMVSSWKKWRHSTLKATVNNLLKDGKMQKDFWSHPEIESLRAADTTSPGYLEGGRFASVVLDIATGQGAEGVIPDSRAAFARTFEKYAPSGLLERLRSLLRSVPPETADLRATITGALARWYDEAMSRTTGSYKRRVQKWLFWTGLGAALILNCDTLRISYVLFRDPGLRSSMVDYAKSISESQAGPTNRPMMAAGDLSATNVAPTAELQSALRAQIKELQKLERIGFPIGWVAPFSANFLPFHADNGRVGVAWMAAAVLLKIIGSLATAFAICLGAPFWFDVLNKLVKLRGSGAKPAADSGGGPSAAPTGPSGSGPGTGGSVATPARTSKPLRSIGEALREPGTQFQAAKAYWLAEASALAYCAPAEIEATVKKEWRFDRVTHFNDANTNTQGFLAVGAGVAILAFRGTEPGQLPDWQTDANAFLKASPDYPGKIHSGFATALAGVYAAVRTVVDALPGSGALLYITGHSLGAALATLVAHRIAAADHDYPIQGVCTYGSPRVGDPDFARSYRELLGQRTYRIVNNEDLVTRVPPRVVGYDHVGEMVYIDDAGRLQRDIGFWYRFLNLAANAAEDFKKAAKTTVRDHSGALYCEHLKRAATEES